MGKRVLVVDDEKSIRITLKEFIHEWGYEVYTVADAEEALKTLRKYDFDVIIIDIILPKIDGIKLFEEIRKISPDVQVVIMTGEPTVETAVSSIRGGVFDYVLKPVSKSSIKKIIESAIRVKNLNDEKKRLEDENQRYREHLEKLVEERTKALKESEAKYKTLTENLNIGIYRMTLGKENKFIEVNPELVKMFLYESKEKLLNVDIPDLFLNPYDLQILVDKLEKFSFIRDEEVQMKRRDGSSFVASLSIVTIKDENGKVIYYDGVIQDITKRKEIERKLRNFGTALQDSREAVIIYDLERNIIAWDSGAELVYGWAEEEALRMNLKDITPEAELNRIEKFINRLTNGEIIDPVETVHLSKNGEMVHVRSTLSLLKNDEGEEFAIVSTDRDITEKKRVERELRESEERYRTLVDALGEGVIVVDLDNKVSIANPSAGRIFGIESEDLIGHTIDEFLDDKNREVFENQMEQVYRGEKSTFELEVTIFDGTKRLINITATPRIGKDLSIFGFQGIFRDITEMRKMEEEILKAEKLESVGILASGIAHDFNNILTGVIGNITLAKLCIEDNEKAYKRLEEAEKASFRAKDLTQRLLTFTRGKASEKEPTRLRDLLNESISISLRGSRVNYELSVKDDIWMIEVDRGQIVQVLNNLIINACQAMPEGGIVRIKAENVELDSDNTLSLEKGRYVKISVEDEGIGIPDKYIKRIFDPFFTTKQKGTGLGLSSSYFIVKEHKGLITVESKLGVGSTFFIYLPATSKKEVQEQKEEEEINVEISGSRVLIMDDEELVRDILEDVLTSLGCEVEFSVNGDKTIELYKKSLANGKRYDAVILDLTIPGGMGAEETVKALRKIDPNVKAIVSSGYADNVVVSEYEKYGFAGKIIKPFELKDLCKALYEAINK